MISVDFAAAGGQDSGACRAAIAALCEKYWYPLYAYVRRRGADAVDVTGSVVVDGKPAQTNVRIMLAHEVNVLTIPDPQTTNTLNRIATFQPPINADGSFTIPLVPEGAYRAAPEFRAI